jgi:metallo-beta-lactamase family protein
MAAESILNPVLDDQVDLLGDSSGPRLHGLERRLAPEAVVRPDWHNELAQVSFELRAALEAAADNRSREIILRRVRRALRGEEGAA